MIMERDAQWREPRRSRVAMEEGGGDAQVRHEVRSCHRPYICAAVHHDPSHYHYNSRETTLRSLRRSLTPPPPSYPRAQLPWLARWRHLVLRSLDLPSDFEGPNHTRRSPTRSPTYQGTAGSGFDRARSHSTSSRSPPRSVPALAKHDGRMRLPPLNRRGAAVGVRSCELPDSGDDEMGSSDEDGTARTPTMDASHRVTAATTPVSRGHARQAAAVAIQRRMRGRSVRRAAMAKRAVPRSVGSARQAAAVAIQRRLRGMGARRAAAAHRVVPHAPMPRSVGSTRQTAAVTIQRRMRGMGARRTTAARQAPLRTGHSLSSRMLSAAAGAAEAAAISTEAAAVVIQRRTRGIFGRQVARQVEDTAHHPGCGGHRRSSPSHPPSSGVGHSQGERLQFLSRPSLGVRPSLVRALSSSLDDVRNELPSPPRSRPATAEESRRRAIAFVSSIGSPPTRHQQPSIANVARALRPPAAHRDPSRPTSSSLITGPFPSRSREAPKSASGDMTRTSKNTS